MEAQLVLIGGRSSVPNLLTILYQCPEVVLALTSIESSADFPKFKSMVKTFLPGCNVEELPPVDAFEHEAIQKRCEEAFQRYPEAHWICNITPATAIMSIATYEQARRFQNPCWYLNTARSRVIALVGPKLDSEHEEALFHMEVKQYVAAYYYSLEDGDLEERRDWCEKHWLPFAQLLGKEPRLAFHLKSITKAIGDNKPKKEQPKGYTLTKLPQEAYDLLKQAEQLGLVNKLSSVSELLKFTLTDLQYSFLNGGWLEAYVWDEARKLGLFDDCQWNRKVRISGIDRELDVAITYKAQLIIVECKTGDEVYDTEVLDKFVAVANPLGERFVGKILISSLPPLNPSDPKEAKKHKEFVTKAEQRRIVVIMADELFRVREWLKREAIEPTYPRI